MKRSILALLVMAFMLGGCGPGNPTGPAAPPARTLTPAPTMISQEAVLAVPTNTQEPNTTPTVTPLPEWTRPADGMQMVYVPQGEFSMGENFDAALKVCSWNYANCQVIRKFFEQEGPRHTVMLKAFWIDKTPVTNAMYALCMQAGDCAPITFFSTPMPVVSDPIYANFPVTYVDWYDASAYCLWAGARLPTEAEWEKAARGTDGRIFPWGNLPPTSTLVNTGLAVRGITEVGKYPAGASSYGVLDMAGNVEQWVADWYSDSYYAVSPAADPQGPVQGQTRVYRGSFWNDTSMDIVAYARSGVSPYEKRSEIGFRCVRPGTPTGLVPPPLNPSTWKRPADGMLMLAVPEGDFSMGDSSDQAMSECQKFLSGCFASWFEDEQPVHTVRLQAFWIDQTEVTNGMYALCEQAGVCAPPSDGASSRRSTYYNDAKYADFPVINVVWDSASAYCRWAGARLPTEAEWEKAARGPEGRTYPWGDELPSPGLANFGENLGDTRRVGKYPAGASPYGALDMAGNVMEWVSDWYSETYYAGSPASDPTGPTDGKYHVLRGGGWYSSNPGQLRTGFRYGLAPSVSTGIGFRCARSYQ